MAIGSKIKQKLRASAHPLKPVVIIGNRGLTEAVQLEIERALLTHALIKIRIQADTAKTRTEMIQKICADRSAELIQIIGHIVVIYRKKEKNKGVA